MTNIVTARTFIVSYTWNVATERIKVEMSYAQGLVEEAKESLTNRACLARV